MNGVCLVCSVFCFQDPFKLQYLNYLPMPGQKNYPRNQYLLERLSDSFLEQSWHAVDLRQGLLSAADC